MRGRGAGLGLRLSPITPEARERFQLSADQKGVLITGVLQGTPAGDKGLKPGDVIPISFGPDVPVMVGAVELAAADIGSSLQPANLAAVSWRMDAPQDPKVALMTDPQTCGGLLASVPAGEAEVLVARLREYGIEPRHLRSFRVAADREIGLVQQALAPRRGSTSSLEERELTAQLLALLLDLHIALVRQRSSTLEA